MARPVLVEAMIRGSLFVRLGAGCPLAIHMPDSIHRQRMG
jgi:hypothetical protein